MYIVIKTTFKKYFYNININLKISLTSASLNWILLSFCCIYLGQLSIKCLVCVIFKLSKTTGQSVSIIFSFFLFSIFYTTPRWHNKRMLTKGYSVPQDFSWIENYKLICQKKGWLKFLLTLNFHCSKFLSPLENFVT